MGFTAGDVVSDVMAYLNRPSEAELPLRDIIRILNRKVNRLLLLAQITDRNFLAKLSDPFTFNGSEMARDMSDISDLSSIVRVESRSIGSDDLNWAEEAITDYGAWNDTMDRGIDAVAFYGSSPDSLTMAVNRDASSLEFRIMYETGGVTLNNFNDLVPVLQDFFRGVVFYGTAGEAGMQLANTNAEEAKLRAPKIAYALQQEAQATEDFKMWMKNTPGQSVAYREAFNSNREGSGQTRMFAQNQLGGYYSRY
jgi:hypothetical protein